MNPTTIGLDLAKTVFEVHGVNDAGAVVLQKRLRRNEVGRFFANLPPCRIALEACSTAHHWARELAALGHDVRLIATQYVKPYVRRGKNDRADAAAICEALTRPSMRFVPIKTAEQQARLSVHRVRELLVKQQTMLSNALRGQLAEFGLAVPKGRGGLDTLLAALNDPDDDRIPALARQVVKLLADQLTALHPAIAAADRQLRQEARQDATVRRLTTIPGIGPVIASAIAATLPDPAMFRSGRDFAAWIGLTPRQTSSGGKTRLGGISKQGDSYLRRLLVGGAQAVILRSKAAQGDPWLCALRRRRPPMVVAVALANKLARIAWAMMIRQTEFRQGATPAAIPMAI